MYGPGAMVDLPDYSVLIGGLDFWNDRGCDPIHEPWLLRLHNRPQVLLGWNCALHQKR